MGTTTGPSVGSITKGEVRAVREVRAGVQAKVCLGADVALGYATIDVTCSSPAVVQAMLALKQALRDEALTYVKGVLDGHAAWEARR